MFLYNNIFFIEMNQPKEADKYLGTEDDDVRILSAIHTKQANICNELCSPNSCGTRDAINKMQES